MEQERVDSHPQVALTPHLPKPKCESELIPSDIRSFIRWADSVDGKPLGGSSVDRAKVDFWLDSMNKFDGNYFAEAWAPPPVGPLLRDQLAYKKSFVGGRKLLSICPTLLPSHPLLRFLHPLQAKKMSSVCEVAFHSFSLAFLASFQKFPVNALTRSGNFFLASNSITSVSSFTLSKPIAGWSSCPFDLVSVFNLDFLLYLDLLARAGSNLTLPPLRAVPFLLRLVKIRTAAHALASVFNKSRLLPWPVPLDC